MKNLFPVVVAALVVVLGISGEGFAYRGGRGGGGGRGGASRGGGGGARPSVNRSPSMSRIPPQSRPQIQRPPAQRPQAQRPQAQRPATRPAQRPTAQRPSTRPQPGRGFLDLPASSPGSRPVTALPGKASRPSSLNRPPSRDQIKSKLGNNPGRPSNLPSWFESGASTLPAQARPATRPGNNGPATRPNLPANRSAVRHPATRPPYASHRPISPGHIRPWHPNHPGHGHHRPGYWWRPATVIGLTGWVAGRWSQPIDYSYGTGGSVYYEDGTVYVDGEQYSTAEQYYDEASTIAESTPEITAAAAEDMEWLPLGVFALTSNDIGASQMYLQLAINKESVISGTFYNETTGVSFEVEGYVDTETQRAAWHAPDSKNPEMVMETGVYNLTKDEADVLVHFGPDLTQTWKMVRLAESDRPAE